MLKKLKGRFGIFQHPFCRKTPTKLKGDPFGEKNFQKNVSQCRKKTERGTLWSHPVLYGTRETFLVVSWANRGNLKFYRTFGRTILVTSGVSKKTVEKTLQKKRRLKNRAYQIPHLPVPYILSVNTETRPPQRNERNHENLNLRFRHYGRSRVIFLQHQLFY